MSYMWSDRFTFFLPPKEREILTALASQQGISTGEYVRRVLAEKIAQLEQHEESTP